MPLKVNYSTPQTANVKFCFTVDIVFEARPAPMAADARTGITVTGTVTGQPTQVQKPSPRGDNQAANEFCYSLPAGNYTFTATYADMETSFQIVVQ